MKYIVLRYKGEEQIFPFPKNVNHDRMLEVIHMIKIGSDRNWDREYRDADLVSAGFISNGICHGHSETLKIKSRGDLDTALLQKMM